MNLLKFFLGVYINEFGNKISGEFKDGKYHGKQTSYSKNGKVIKNLVHINGVEISSTKITSREVAYYFE